MCRYFTATDEFAVETTQDMDPERRRNRLMPGLVKAMLTVDEPADDAHPLLPTLREFLANHTDPRQASSAMAS
jgi:hypothetical protein